MVLNCNFPERFNRFKLKYTSGALLHKFDNARPTQDLPGGLILGLPLVGIKDTLAQVIRLEQLRDDRALLSFIDDRLGSIRVKRLTNEG